MHNNKSVEQLFDIATGRTSARLPSHAIRSLPDFDFDRPSNQSITIGTNLSLKTGKPHPVAYSTNPIPWGMTKESCDKLGIPHVDILSNSVLDGFNEYPTLEELDKPEYVEMLYSTDLPFYHIRNHLYKLKNWYHLRTAEDIAMFAAIIRPGLNDMFYEKRLQLKFHSPALMNALNGNYIIFQEDMIRCLEAIFGFNTEDAEFFRKQNETFWSPVMDPNVFDNNPPDLKLFDMVYNKINPNLLSAGHCLQVAYIVLLQAYHAARSS